MECINCIFFERYLIFKFSIFDWLINIKFFIFDIKKNEYIIIYYFILKIKIKMISYKEINYIIDLFREVESSISEIDFFDCKSNNNFLYSFLYIINFRQFIINKIYENKNMRFYLNVFNFQKNFNSLDDIENIIKNNNIFEIDFDKNNLHKIYSKNLVTISFFIRYLENNNILNLNNLFLKKLSFYEFEKFKKNKIINYKNPIYDFYKNKFLWKNNFDKFFDEKYEEVKIEYKDKLKNKKDIWYTEYKLMRLYNYNILYKSYQSINNFNFIKYFIAKYIFDIWNYFKYNSNQIKFLYLFHFCKNYEQYKKFHSLFYKKISQKKIDLYLIWFFSFVWIFTAYFINFNIWFFVFLIIFVVIIIGIYSYKRNFLSILPTIRAICLWWILISVIYFWYEININFSKDSLLNMTVNILSWKNK